MSASKLVGAMGVIAVLCGGLYIVVAGEPRLPIGIADGTYSNGCCGKLVLQTGMMTVADQCIGYVIGRDKVGPYVLPETYVGASPKGFVVKHGAYALKLRLDDATQPHHVELVDDSPGGADYRFVRNGAS